MTSYTSVVPHAAGTVGYRSSGPSPTVHLVGPGRVGRALLRRLATEDLRLVGATDGTATVYARTGLDPAAVADHKEAGRPLAAWPGAEPVPAALAVALVAADVVVDATPSAPDRVGADVARGRAVLAGGRCLVLAGKQALCRAAGRWLHPDAAPRLGCNAVLGGTGARFVAELPDLRRRWRSLALVANASSTAVLTALESGRTLDEGIADARRFGLLEGDPTLDLDGTDAAVKLALVTGGLLGRAVDPDDVRRQDLRRLDAARLRAAARAGRTARLVARADRRGRLAVRVELLQRTDPLAAPADRVVYAYRLDRTLRVHTGTGLGPEGTAEALLADLYRHTAGNRKEER